MDKYNIFVSINYRDEENGGKELISKTRVNNNSISSNRYLIGGGVYNRNGGTIILTAKNLDEVKQVTKDRPLLKNISMKYNVAVIPKGI